MHAPAKILWHEGVILRPQQFQQQDRYHEARLHQLTRALHPHAWGVVDLSWNRDRLAHGMLEAEHMTLLFQDGEIYDAPRADVLPDPVDLNALAQTQDSFTFYAALPSFKQHGGNHSGSRNFDSGVRYAQIDTETPDLYSQAGDAEIAYLRKTVQVLAQTAPRGAYLHFPVARVRRLDKGGFELDRDFVPPSLSIAAAGTLAVRLDNLMKKLLAKMDALKATFREPRSDMVEVLSGDVSSFMMLHAVSAGTAPLRHFAACRDYHPERLFQQLLHLAGALMSLSRRYQPDQLPAYDHLDAGTSFAGIDAIIRDLVDTVISAKYFAIALTHEQGKPIHRGPLDSNKIDGKTMLCLAVRADISGVELVAAVPTLIKVGAPDHVERAMLSALPGLPLVHLPQVPAAIPVRPNIYYFAIENCGPDYEAMLDAQSIAIYVPEGIRNLRLELVALMA